MKLNEKAVLVTGGSLGIGKAIAKLLAESGARVAITGRDAETLERAAAEIGALPIAGDVGRPEDVERTFEVLAKALGRLDCLVNNAGIGGAFERVENLAIEDLEEVFRVNVVGAALMAAQAARLFKKQNHGHIINIGSTAGTKGFESGSVYVASKFALRGMTQCWQAELRKHNVRVILINPSEVATAFGDAGRREREAPANKLRGVEIAHAVKAVLEMDDRGFIPELAVWATNPW